MHDRRLAARAGELKPSAVRELLKHSKLPGVISLGGGIPAPELFDTEGPELAVQKVMSERFNDAFQYGLTEGYPPLRQAVSEIATPVASPVQPPGLYHLRLAAIAGYRCPYAARSGRYYRR